MGALTDSILGRLLRPFSRVLLIVNGTPTPQETWMSMLVQAPLIWTNDRNNQWGALGIDGTAPQSIGALTLTGPTTRGPTWSNDARAVTTGSGSATLFSAPLATGTTSIGTHNITTNDSGTRGADYDIGPNAGWNTLSGSLSVQGSPALNSAFGLPISILFVWAPSTLTVSVRGPFATVTLMASNGAGGTRVSITGGFGLTGALEGESVTIAGATGVAAGTNGPNTAHFVDAGHFDIAVAFTGYSTGGTVVYTTPPVLRWGGSMSITSP